MKLAVTIGIIVGIIIALVIFLVAYSYSQVQVNLIDASLAEIDWSPTTLSDIIKLGLDALSGNWISAALSLVTGIKVNLIFGLGNHGVFPVYIPNLSYSLFINGINLGQGQSMVDTTIGPGETRQLPVLQDFKSGSFEPVLSSLASTNGMMELKINGTAYFKLLGITIPVQFQSTKQISLADEIKKHFSGVTQHQ